MLFVYFHSDSCSLEHDLRNRCGVSFGFLDGGSCREVLVLEYYCCLCFTGLAHRELLHVVIGIRKVTLRVFDYAGLS